MHFLQPNIWERGPQVANLPQAVFCPTSHPPEVRLINSVPNAAARGAGRLVRSAAGGQCGHPDGGIRWKDWTGGCSATPPRPLLSCRLEVCKGTESPQNNRLARSQARRTPRSPTRFTSRRRGTRCWCRRASTLGSPTPRCLRANRASSCGQRPARCSLPLPATATWQAV